jgi:protein-S-isoprenylcysteine O-methyltransferase Ste14
MKRFGKRTWVLLAVVSAAVVAAVGGYAYFTTTGTGTGSASVGTDSGVTLHATTAGLLYPGGPSQTVSFTVDNPSSGHQWVGTIHLVSVATGVAGCLGADFTMPDVVAGQNVAPGGGTVITATGQLSMADNGNQDACKNASLTLNLSSN